MERVKVVQSGSFGLAWFAAWLIPVGLAGLFLL